MYGIAAASLSLSLSLRDVKGQKVRRMRKVRVSRDLCRYTVEAAVRISNQRNENFKSDFIFGTMLTVKSREKQFKSI